MSVVTASLLPDPPKRRHDEGDLQRTVNQYLRWSLPSDAVHFSIPNGLMRSKKAGARAVGEGLRAGVPDLCIIFRGRALFVELKAGRGVLSPTQKQMHKKLIYCGAAVMVCRSIDDVEAGLRECGLHLRATVAA